ncbi:MAG: hypothetical protein LBT97_12045 [Planctomycetota bacterium]|jgi:hypothetical protein|nr:hypothetical protein [Planctomycetota bacterium]
MMRRCLRLFALLLAANLSVAAAGEHGGDEWIGVLTVRFDNIEAIDARDGEVAKFLAGIGVDGAAQPPLRTLVGPLLRNPRLSGFSPDAWLEGMLLAPAKPGNPAWVWSFPAENRDEYRTALERQGLADLENMDETLALSEFDPAGNIRYWHLEWLPGNVAVFGANREAVRAARELYESPGAAGGWLAPRRSRALSPDVRIWFSPSRFAAWQDREPGVYWWRSQVRRLANELAGYWRPDVSRARLIDGLGEELAALPLAWRDMDASLWIGRDGFEWQLDMDGGDPAASAHSRLSAARRLPDRIVQGFAAAFSPRAIEERFAFAGRLLVEGAGGAVPVAARLEAGALLELLREAGIRQIAVGWLPSPAGAPALGSARIMVLECADALSADAAWRRFETTTLRDNAVGRTLAQLGWNVETAEVGAARTIRILPAESGAPYLDLLAAAKAERNLVAAAWAENPADAALRRERAEHLAALVGEALSGDPPGTAGVREAFTLMGADGGDFLALFFPVGFAQLALSENADWRPLAPDEPEPESTRLAREMLEYRDAGPPWTAVGERTGRGWRINGRISWNSLLAFAAALGLTDYLLPD